MTLSDIQNDIYFKTKTNSSSFTNADMLIQINKAYNRVASLILKADDRWQWDDYNQSDLPIATTNLVSGQQDYSLATSHLTIDRIEVLQPSGTWFELEQIDQQLLKRGRRIALEQYLPVPGTPIQYDAIGNSVFLYPTPNYNSTNGLKLYFTRGPIPFTSADLSTGTDSPGFNSLFHDLISLWVSYDFALSNQPTLAPGFMQAIQLKEQAIYDFYGLRNHDGRPRLTVAGSGVSGTLSGQLGYTSSDSNM
jgi:hypothetical protein